MYDWVVPDIPDGMYDLRASVECADGYTYSNVLTGTIDRTAPKLYGIPEPSDGILNNGDIISVSFNEDINCDKFVPANMDITDINTNIKYPAQNGCSGSKIVLIPETGSDEVARDTFKVSMIGITDMADNSTKDTLSWTFMIAGNDSFAVPDTADTDGDGIPDKSDNCMLTFNPDQSELDNDGIGDICDDDVDGDGVLNAVDNCKYIANPDQVDSDSNGIGDVCEDSSDGDKDGIINSEDNCPYTYNPDQADEDNDGIGDVCDDDKDGDGVKNLFDDCASVSNPDQLDSNHDGIGDACQSIAGLPGNLISQFELLQNFPNPFNDFTTIQYRVPEKCQVLIKVYSMLGTEYTVESGVVEKGIHSVIWETKDNPQGVYFYSIYAKSLNSNQVFWNVKKLLIEK